MNPNRLGIFFIVFALIISAFLTFLVYRQQKNKSMDEAKKIVNVLVAAKNLPRGMKLKEGDISWKPWPRHSLSPLFIEEGTRNKADFIGAIVRLPITIGQPITDSVLIAKENVSPLTSMLEPGMRAFSIEINLDAALAGLLVPGDRVDIILTYAVTLSGGNKDYISTTLMHGISVLAIDQEITPMVTTDSKSTSKLVGNKKHVTLLVTPQQAEMLAQINVLEC